MRDYEVELRNRVQFIRDCLEAASAQGIVYGNSGGKDSALVGILCKKACENTVGLIMPCRSRRSYHQDRRDAEAFAQQFGIAARVVDPEGAGRTETAVGNVTSLTDLGVANMAPRLRMTTLMPWRPVRTGWWPVQVTGVRATWAISPNGAMVPMISTPLEI